MSGYKVKETMVKFSDLSTIISGLHFGGEEDLSNIENLIDIWGSEEDEVTIIRSFVPEEESEYKMIKRITISVEEDNGSKMQHTVSTKEEAVALIDRYFKEESA